MAVTVQDSASALITASRSPSVTFGSYTPQLNDVVVMFPNSDSAAATIVTPSGWVNSVGVSTADVKSDAHQMCSVYHLVTAGEVSGGTTTYTPTNLYDTTQTGGVVAAVLRGVDTAAVIDDSNTGLDSTVGATPHVLPLLLGGNLSTGSLVIGTVAAANNGTNYATPSGWTLTVSRSGRSPAMYQRTALTVAGTNVAATNVTPDVGDKYVAITLALSAAPLPPRPQVITKVAVMRASFY